MAQEGVVARYLDGLRVRNMRRWTIYGRERTLARLTKWAGGPILYLTDKDLERWQSDRSKRLQPESLRGETSIVRLFFEWAKDQGFRDDDPAYRLPLPRVARRLPRPIRDKHLADAMAAADPATLAILGLAAFAGLRAMEIAALDWRDVSVGDAVEEIRIQEGKGGHGRVVPLSEPLRAILLDLRTRRGPVITRLDGNPGPTLPQRVSWRANEYLHKMGISETLHQCRHRFATVAFWGCKDLRAVQDLLGHASPTTTAIYTLGSSTSARQAVDAAGHIDAA